MKLRFLTPARRELMRAAAWYDTQSAGLGDRLLDSVRVGLRAIREFPNAHPPLDKWYRRFLLDTFPFSLVYRIEPDEIVIVAVAHAKRRPGYWRRRERVR